MSFGDILGFARLINVKVAENASAGVYYPYKYPWWNRKATRKPRKTGTGITYNGCFRAFLLLKKMKPAGLKTEKGKQTMTPKQQLIDNLNGYKNIYEKIQEEKNRIDKNAVYTDAGKEQQLQLLLGKYEPIIKRYHDTACEIIDQGVEKLNEKWNAAIQKRLTDTGYQVGLQNVLEMFRNDVVKRPEDLQSILQNYSGDYMTLELIRKTILDYSKDENIRATAATIAEDNRDYNLDLLKRTLANVDKYISVDAIKTVSKAWNTFNQGLTGVSVSIAGMVDFCETRLNDDLSLL